MKLNDPLFIKNLFVSIEGKEILHGISLSVDSGEVHAIMGPNGSGKSTLAYALMGHPDYKLKAQNSKLKTELRIGNTSIINASSEERAKAGLFLAFQSPIAIPGVSVVNLLRTSYQELHAGKTEETLPTSVGNPVMARRWKAGGVDLLTFMKKIKEYAKILHIDETFLSRGIHDGFSGGEKKKIEMLQALVLAPKFAVFDEIDTGLDVDALKLVGLGIERLAKNSTGVIVITHYQRILRYIKPDVVHVLVKGKIVDTGSAELAKEIEENGYKKYS